MEASDLAVKSRNIGLVEALDRVLDKGVVVDGDVYLGVAGIELVYLKLKLLLVSTATIERLSLNSSPSDNMFLPPLPPSAPDDELEADRSKKSVSEQSRVIKASHKPLGHKLDIDPKKVEEGLAKLVLTLVNVLRELMERQALRRIEVGTLKDAQIEALGEAFRLLDEKMRELKDVFGLKDSDLNLDLGPLGDLI